MSGGGNTPPQNLGGMPPQGNAPGIPGIPGLTPTQVAPIVAAKPIPLDEAHIDDLLKSMVDKGSSDLHLAVGIPPVVRVDGGLVPLPFDKLSPVDSQRLIYDILTDDQIQRFETELELDFSYQMARVARFRVNVFRDKGNVASAFRADSAENPDPQRPGAAADFGRTDETAAWTRPCHRADRFGKIHYARRHD